MDMPVTDTESALEEVARVVALAVETRAGKKRRLQEEQANKEATDASGVNLTPIGGPVTVVTREPDAEQGREAINPAVDAGLQVSAAQTPLPTAPAGQADITSNPTCSSAQTSKTTARKRRGKRTTNKRKTGNEPVIERSRPDVEISREKLREEQQRDHQIGPILRGEQQVTEPYVVKEGLLYAVSRQERRDGDKEEGEETPLLVVVPETLRASVLYAGHEAAGHFGQAKTRRLICQHFFWPRM